MIQKQKYKFKAFEDALYSIQFWVDGEGVLNLTETCNLTKNSLGSYNPLYKTLWKTPEQQLKALARNLKWSKLLDKKDKKLLSIFFKEYLETND